MKNIILLLPFLYITGCATNYKPNGFVGNGGFDDTELAPKYFRVTFKGNEKTSLERATDFALLRTAELMQNKQCESFEIVKSTNEIRKGNIFLPQTQSTNVQVTNFGSTSVGNATTTNYGGGMAVLNFPKVTMESKCSDMKPDIQKSIYDTGFIINTLKHKYKID